MSRSKPPVAWLPYADLAEAEARTGGLPDGVQVECFLDDGSWPDSIGDVEFLVVPYLKGPEVLRRAEEMTSLKVVQSLSAGVENLDLEAFARALENLDAVLLTGTAPPHRVA